jgi:hypothetical protein
MRGGIGVSGLGARYDECDYPLFVDYRNPLAVYFFPTQQETAVKMTFPKWVETHKDDNARASARLRYIVSRLAVEFSEDMSVRAISDAIGYDHSTLWCGVRRGRFSADMAFAIQGVLEKRKCTLRITAEHLMSPLSIEG